MILRLLTVTLVFVFIAIGTIFGCGGGGGGNGNGNGDCNFDILSLSNGEDVNSQDSFWLCNDPRSFQFQIFDDGSGFSQAVGAFNWVQTSCDSISFQSALGSAEAINIMAGGGVLTFEQVSNVEELDGLNVACVLFFL